MSFFKKKGTQVNAANVQMTEAEAALAQSDFNIEKITELQNKFAGGAILLVPGRIFIREGALWKMCRRGLKKRHFILFNDILVYCTTVANRYSHQHILPLSQMAVSAECFYQPTVQADFDLDAEVDEQLDVANAFQISHANKSFHVFALSAADKANWLVNLTKHITRANQSILNDSEQQLITRPVWVPDAMTKECMLCKVKFTPFVRKHHCRRCGRVVCSSCSPHRVSLNEMSKTLSVTASTEPNAKLERACKECFKAMTAIHRLSSSQSGATSTTPSLAPPRPSEPPKRTGSSSKVEDSTPAAEHDSSTDTEDSDDSGDEQDAVTEKLAKVELEQKKEQEEDKEEIPAKKEEPPPAAEEPCPTPPPRKKKLQKQLQQQLQKQLHEQQLKEQQQLQKQQQEQEQKEQDQEEEESEQKPEQHDQQEEDEDEGQSTQHEKPAGESPKSVHSEESNPPNDAASSEGGDANAPKKSRRKNKYLGTENAAEESIPEGEAGEGGKDEPSPPQKRPRGRRQKFKPPTESN